jgi:hypothetical protein
MMGFNDFDVGIVAHDFGGHFQKFQRQVDADAHVRRVYHGNFFGGIGNRRFLRLAETGGADDDAFTGLAADLQILY